MESMKERNIKNRTCYFLDVLYLQLVFKNYLHSNTANNLNLF